MTTQQGDDDIDERKMITVRNNKGPLPFDMIVEIFTRLPGKSLFKFKCISNTLCSIINTRSFRDSLISISLSRPRLLFADIIRSGDGDGDGDECQFRFFSSPYPPRKSDDSSQLSMIYKFNLLLYNRFQSALLQYTSLRGFIFIGYLPSRKSIVCNLITKQIISLPQDPEFDRFPPHKCFMYLGYDPSKDQYKVLRVIVPYVPPVIIEYSVCTLGGGEPSSLSWRRIEKKLSSYTWLSQGVCINGVVYFQTFYIERIVSFNVGSEKLSFIEVPGNINNLINHQGKLASISMCDGDYFSLWVLEDEKKQKWSKRKFVNVFPSLKVNVMCKGTTNDGELIFEPRFLSNNPYVVYYYDMRKATIRTVTLEGISSVDGFEVNNENCMRKFVSYDHVDNIITL